MAFNIFISYSTHDLAKAQTLKKQIESPSVTVFIAEDSISPSEKLTDKIIEAIEECDLFVVFWSKNAKNSDWVNQEIGKAKSDKKKILPLVSDNMQPPGFIANLKYIPLSKDSEKGLKKAEEFIENERINKNGADTLAIMAISAVLFWVLK